MFIDEHDSAIALSKLFLLNNPRAINMTVKGDIVADPDGGIVTRSKAKQSKKKKRWDALAKEKKT